MALRIPATFETEVAMRADGFILIAQTYADDDPFEVLLSRGQAKLVANELLRLANDDSNWPSGDSVEGD